MSVTNEKSGNTPSPSPRQAYDVVDNKGLDERRKGYPTMSMIISRLFENLFQAIYYFQHDSLWKSMAIASTSDRTHDVYGQKGVSLKAGKSAHCFQQDTGEKMKDGVLNFGVEPTISMTEKELGANRHFPAIPYVIENRIRSYLARRGNGFRTQDLFQTKRLGPGRPPFDTWRNPGISSL